MNRASISRRHNTMGAGVLLYQPEPEAVAARCRALGVDRVGISCTGLPGFDRETCTGVPDRAFLIDLVDRLAEQAIQVCCLSRLNALGLDGDIVRNPAAHRREIDAMLATIDAAGQAGIGTILHYVNPIEPEDPADDDEMWRNLVSIFKELVAQAEISNVKLANHGIWMCVPDGLREEAVASGLTYANYRSFRPEGWQGPFLVRTADHIGRIVEDEVPSPSNGVCLCTGMFINGDDPLGMVDRFSDKVHFVQIRDIVGRWPDAREVFPGEGDVDLPGVLQALHGSGFTGMVHPEHLGRPHHPDHDLEAEAVARVTEWIDDLPAPS